MHDQIVQTLAVLGGLLSGMLAWMFDVPAPTVFAAFMGACFGVAISKEIYWFTALLLLLAGTVASALLVPLLIQYLPGWSQKGIAGLLAFVVIGFRDEVLAGMHGLIGAGFTSLQNWISGWTPGDFKAILQRLRGRGGDK